MALHQANHCRSNIALIGMPGAGKSTIGILLAKETGKGFVDTDILVQTRERKTLQQLLDEQGYMQLRTIEEQVLLNLDEADTVIATGGSAVHSKAGVQHLASGAVIVYLEATMQVLRQRIRNYSSRGIARQPAQTFEELFAERTKLYQKYADITVNCEGVSPEQVVAGIMDELDRQ